MKAAVVLLIVVAMLLLFVLFQQPKCPKCKSKDICLFVFHGKRVFTCHQCGNKDGEECL